MKVADIYASQHTMDRFKEHYPNAGWRALKGMMSRSLLVNPERVRDIIGWGWALPGDIYILAPDRRGIFVVARGEVVVTYLRLRKDHAFACTERWPRPKNAA